MASTVRSSWYSTISWHSSPPLQPPQRLLYNAWSRYPIIDRIELLTAQEQATNGSAAHLLSPLSRNEAHLPSAQPSVADVENQVQRPKRLRRSLLWGLRGACAALLIGLPIFVIVLLARSVESAKPDVSRKT